MKRIFLMFVLMFAVVGYAFGECSNADKTAMEAFDRAWGDAGVKGDRTALMAIYADDYAGLPGMQNKTQTIDATMAGFEKDKANPNMADKVSHDNYMITCTPTSAVITHRNIIWTKNGTGGKEETFGRVAFIFSKNAVTNGKSSATPETVWTKMRYSAIWKGTGTPPM